MAIPTSGAPGRAVGDTAGVPHFRTGARYHSRELFETETSAGEFWRIQK